MFMTSCHEVYRFQQGLFDAANIRAVCYVRTRTDNVSFSTPMRSCKNGSNLDVWTVSGMKPSLLFQVTIP